MIMQGMKEGEATLKLKVTRADGTEEEYTGDTIELQLTPDKVAAIEEYKRLVVRLRELEQIILGE
jgi:hypothetical protein